MEKTLTISEKLLNDLIAYLAQKPFNEVVTFISRINQEVKMYNQPPKPAEPPKEQ